MVIGGAGQTHLVDAEHCQAVLPGAEHGQALQSDAANA